jgi:GNAT superfamily N-acetyltransferase
MRYRITIRAACESDADAIAGLMGGLGYPSTPAEIEQRLCEISSRGGSRVVVAEVDDAVVALVSIHLIPMLHAAGSTGRVTAFVVADGYRGSGIGRQTMDAAVGWAWESDCRKLEVTPGDERSDAHRLYERIGFVKANRRYVLQRPTDTSVDSSSGHTGTG